MFDHPYFFHSYQICIAFAFTMPNFIVITIHKFLYAPIRWPCHGVLGAEETYNHLIRTCKTYTIHTKYCIYMFNYIYSEERTRDANDHRWGLIGIGSNVHAHRCTMLISPSTRPSRYSTNLKVAWYIMQLVVFLYLYIGPVQCDFGRESYCSTVRCYLTNNV